MAHIINNHNELTRNYKHSIQCLITPERLFLIFTFILSFIPSSFLPRPLPTVQFTHNEYP